MALSNLHPSKQSSLPPQKLASLIYHDFFDYPLNQAEITKWELNPKIIRKLAPASISKTNNFYILHARTKLINFRLKREKISETKLNLAKKASNLIGLTPTIKFIGVTGSLAMKNAKPSDDLDLLLITRKNTLWLTRLLVYVLLFCLHYPVRFPGEKKEKDKLCLNIWLAENDLLIKSQNLFTAHEIAQIIPLVDKKNTFNKFLSQNKWILNYWPNSIEIKSDSRIKSYSSQQKSALETAISIINLVAYKIQYFYMKTKITKEKISFTQAFFHPHSSWPDIQTKLKNKLQVETK